MWLNKEWKYDIGSLDVFLDESLSSAWSPSTTNTHQIRQTTIGEDILDFRSAVATHNFKAL